MKNSGLLYTLIAAIIFVAFPRVVFASTDVTISGNGDGSYSDVSVDSHSEGTTTICHNGHCTTTGGGSNATVCINGNCRTDTDGNLDMQSKDGQSQVHVGNTTDDAPSVTIPPKPTEASPSLTPDPTITQMRNDINKHMKEQTEAIKKHLKNQETAISQFIRQEMDSLNQLLSNLFD